MGRIAFVFPGQGTQHVGMGQDLYLKYQAARDVFAAASDILGMDLAHLCFYGPREALDLTENTQLAVLTCNLAIYRVFAERVKLLPAVVAGHSVGEYAALAAAGIIEDSQAFPLVKARAGYHQEAAPVGAGAMAAILGLNEEDVAGLCATASDAGAVVSVSIINAPGQVVVSGNSSAVDRAVALAGERAGVKAVRLPISVPCHCGLLAGAALALKVHLDGIPFQEGIFPVIPNCAPDIFYTKDNATGLLMRQITSPVRWQETIVRMVSMGVDTVVELGPKRTLVNIIKRIDRNIKLLSVEDGDSLDKACACFNG
ncbi:MAG: ACP S-malonyltransferase [Smithellaceae bacterium]|nr:ACP S-malonyltransferase [Smithellaceae bacterium]